MSDLHREHTVIAAPPLVLLLLAKGEVVALCVGRTNAAMACPARPLGNRADKCRTLKKNTDRRNRQVSKILYTGKVKTTQFILEIQEH